MISYTTIKPTTGADLFDIIDTVSVLARDAHGLSSALDALECAAERHEEIFPAQIGLYADIAKLIAKELESIENALGVIDESTSAE